MSAECLGTLGKMASFIVLRLPHLEQRKPKHSNRLAPPVVLDDEAVVLRPDQTSDFDGLRSRHGQAAAVLWSMT